MVMGRYCSSVSHWYVAKWHPRISSISPPPGMKWFAVPPYNGFRSRDVLWFPTGKAVHAYLTAIRPAR